MENLTIVITMTILIVCLISIMIIMVTDPCKIYHNFYENEYCPHCGEYVDKLPNCECGKEYTSTEQKYCTACGKEKENLDNESIRSK